MTIDRESLRPAFERAFPTPWGITWCTERNRYVTGHPTSSIDAVPYSLLFTGFCAAIESLGEPVTHVSLGEWVDDPRKTGVKRVETRQVPLYRLPAEAV